MNALRKTIFHFPLKFHLCSLQKVQNLVFSPGNRFNRSWNRFNRFWDCSSATPALTCLTVRAVRKVVADVFGKPVQPDFSRLNQFWIRSSLRLSRSVDRVLPGGNRFNRFSNRFNRFLPLFSQRLPAFGGSFIYPPHSLSYLLPPLPRSLGWPNSQQVHSFHLSHPQSHLLQSFEGPLVWGELDRTRC